MGEPVKIPHEGYTALENARLEAMERMGQGRSWVTIMTNEIRKDLVTESDLTRHQQSLLVARLEDELIHQVREKDLEWYELSYKDRFDSIKPEWFDQIFETSAMEYFLTGWLGAMYLGGIVITPAVGRALARIAHDRDPMWAEENLDLEVDQKNLCKAPLELLQETLRRIKMH